MTTPRVPVLDPRNPRESLLTVVVVLIVLGFVIWILVAWPDSILLFRNP